jgi:toxin ParE1/3/4
MILHPEAEREIEEAAEFYERQGSPRVATKFIAEFKRMVALIAQHPHIGAPRQAGCRGLRMKVFPYTVVYRVTAEEVKVLVVKHDRKRPGYGSSRP